jgi:hypothetical protein
VLADVIATVRKVALRVIGVFVTRFDLFLVSMAIGAERFLVAGTAYLAGCSRVKTMLGIKVGGAMIQSTPGVAMACRAVGHPQFADIFRVCERQAGGVGTGVQQTHQQ